MPEIILKPGDSEKIISQPASGEKYNLKVSNVNVYVSHNANAIVNQGTEVEPSDRFDLKNLRGKSIYAKNPPSNTETATLDISEASFDIEFFPRRDVTVDQGGTFETNNYSDGEVLTGNTYPLSSDPSITVEHLVVIENPGDKTIDVTTSTGNTITGIPLGTGNLSLTALSIDSIDVNDPSATTGTTTILMIGE